MAKKIVIVGGVAAGPKAAPVRHPLTVCFAPGAVVG